MLETKCPNNRGFGEREKWKDAKSPMKIISYFFPALKDMSFQNERVHNAREDSPRFQREKNRSHEKRSRMALGFSKAKIEARKRLEQCLENYEGKLFPT